MVLYMHPFAESIYFHGYSTYLGKLQGFFGGHISEMLSGYHPTKNLSYPSI